MSKQNLFEHQAEQLLNELSSIITEKWLVLTNQGHSLIKTLFNHYSSLFQSDSEDDQKQLDYERFTMINESNQIHERLRSDIILKLESLTSRVGQIKKNLNSLLTMNLETFEDIDLEEFKSDLDNLHKGLENEISLKKLLVTESLFKARFNVDDQVAIVSTWIHQPFIDELTTQKIVSIIKLKLGKK